MDIQLPRSTSSEALDAGDLADQFGGGDHTESAFDQLRAEMDIEDWIAADAAIGLQAEQLFLKVFNLQARAAFFAVEPWTEDELQRRTSELARQYVALPRAPASMSVSAGDPHLESWLTADPLRDASQFVLERSAEHGTDVEKQLAADVIGRYHL